ncbi:hypothetical protein QR680_004988 [Steinernema hermaphroditum]|uniref:Uncharacterized protein n=1 Tax=Steinernema hermaphroditum TaxID=289476 RepID=A0AA39HQG2_9BILA|nr:hypothetical protein QR680_004988 [Steinernema hermaphroditum]
MERSNLKGAIPKPGIIQARKPEQMEKTVEITMPDVIANTEEYKEAEDEIKQTKNDINDRNSLPSPLMVPTKN